MASSQTTQLINIINYVCEDQRMKKWVQENELPHSQVPYFILKGSKRNQININKIGVPIDLQQATAQQ